jgi:hypothetical protein
MLVPHAGRFLAVWDEYMARLLSWLLLTKVDQALAASAE